jgi:hypothetical protein
MELIATAAMTSCSGSVEMQIETEIFSAVGTQLKVFNE